VTWEIGLVFFFLAATAILFSMERLRVDVVAILIMLGLAWSQLVTPAEAFSGFSSNAVIAVIGVMIMSFGLDRAGAMNSLARLLMRTAGTSESKLLALVCSTVAALSAFMQNVGAAALFLPILVRMSKSGRFSLSRLLMPMGFAVILGGTLTMVGSGPLIILNDLLKHPADIIGTITHPTIKDIAVLASIIVIRTIISYFLDREMADSYFCKDGVGPQNSV